MNAKVFVVGLLFTAALAASLVSLQRASRAEARAREEVARLEADLARLRESNEISARETDALRAESGSRPSEPARAPAESVDAAVARWFAANRPDLIVAAADAAAEVKKAAPSPAAGSRPALSLEEAARMLLDPAATDESRQEIWNRLRAQGMLEQAVAWFEERARLAPNDAQAQADLGAAYVQKIFDVPDGPEKGAWATKADRAWDRALELDPRHWEARFSKAIGLSFWPPIFGKAPEAIRQFETLLEQQDAGPVRPEHAQTYLLLGNLYAQTGAADKAAALWQRGLTLFPGNADLQSALASRR